MAYGINIEIVIYEIMKSENNMANEMKWRNGIEMKGKSGGVSPSAAYHVAKINKISISASANS
jgi:hypothetical protein